MGRFVFLMLLIVGLAAESPRADAQIIRKAGQFLQTAFDESATDSVTPALAPAAERENSRADSATVEELAMKIREMQLNEVMLRSELESARTRNQEEDSLRDARRRHTVDSLRAVTPGVPVLVENDTLFMLYAPFGAYSPEDRATRIADTIMKIAGAGRLSRDSVYTRENEEYVDIMYGDRILMSVTLQDALWQNTSQKKLAENYGRIIDAKIDYLRKENSFWQILRRAGLFVAVLVIQYLVFKLINYLFRRLRRRIIRFKQQRLKPLYIRDYELLNKRRLTRVLILASNLVRWMLLATVLIFTVPILFAIFPQTENLALRIFVYILSPVRMVLKGILNYIPNLFIIGVIWICVRYIVRGIHYIAEEIHSEKLKISGFYPDWARPTFNIIRFMLYAFMIAMIYPYLPGSESGVFQGISVFVGLIVSLGSSTVISNFIAGFVITYMRPFREGDFIKVKDTVGNVIEKTPFVTRLRTIKNEVVTIPNSFIMSSDTVNYSASARRYGLIVHTVMTMGYEVPWRKVHDLLIRAALHTPGILHEPQPFVLELELNDNYMSYQINAYTDNADELPRLTSDLLQNIQDYFHDAGVELVAPHYFATRDGSASRIPPDRRPR
ncbi:MAG: mechanosensitive ion channel family protein [Muribaculaceae bacterium]|nr:mechanosensitive ion channel family protein [Muribaculaceae bacterium]